MELRPDAPPAEACEEIILADGNPYRMLRPTLELVAHVGDNGIEVRPESGTPGLDDALGRMAAAADDPTYAAALVEAALLLIRPCHDFAPADIPRLFRFSADSDLAGRLSAVVLGRTPAKN